MRMLRHVPNTVELTSILARMGPSSLSLMLWRMLYEIRNFGTMYQGMLRHCNPGWSTPVEVWRPWLCTRHLRGSFS